MRTTVDLPADLLAEAKTRAAREGRSVSAVVSDAIRNSFARASDPGAQPVTLPTVAGDGVQPGVDLDDGAALVALMERAD